MIGRASGAKVAAYAWAAAALSGCAHGLPSIPVDELPEAAMVPEPYRIGPGDTVSILVWNQAKMSADTKVRSDGQLTLPLVGDIAVQGLTPAGAATQIQHRLEGLVVDPKVTVAVKESTLPTFSVVGEVKNSGSFPVGGSTTVLQALAAAGGLNEFADRDKIFVIRRSPETKRIRFSYGRLIHAQGRGVSFVLQGGDIVVVE